MLDVTVESCQFFGAVIIEDSRIIHTLFDTIRDLLSQGAGVPLASVDGLAQGEQQQTRSDILVVGMIKTNKV